jgi:hypothetical protein
MHIHFAYLNSGSILLHAENRQNKVDAIMPSASSLEHLPVCFSHQPDLVTNSICSEQAAAKLQHLELKRVTLENQISALRCNLKQRTLGFEAMLVLVKYLSEEVGNLLSVCQAYIEVFT